MSNEKLSKLEGIKEQSRFLRGSIQEELGSDSTSFVSDNTKLLKFHGTYQQDNRDLRKGGEKHYSFMVRSRIPGGKITAAQLLAELDLCEVYGNGTLRITDRQGFQLHGVLKQDLRSTINGINRCKLSTIAACGDVCRNFMCCPAPYKDSPVRAEMQKMVDTLAAHFRPRTSAYYEIWLKDGEESEKVYEEVTDEPIYGVTYLPRKFKMAIALPEDNCIDVYTHDLGLIAVAENDKIIGYNVLVGGSQGMTPANKNTFPAIGRRLAFVPPEQLVAVCEAIVKVQRDFGNRVDRKQARMKYLVANWGVPKFKAKVEEYFGAELADPHPADIHEVEDHMGWHQQGDGNLFLGINIENGRIKDEGDLRIKSGLRALLAKFPQPLRLTALQGIIMCDVKPEWKPEIEAILKAHGMALAEELSLARRYSISCPALPTCGLAVTESERIMPGLMDEIDEELRQQGLSEERITIHLTGCPNGCARPYTPDIGLVGKARGKYTIYLGGNAQGTRMCFLYQDMVAQEDLRGVLSPIFSLFREQRQPGESFGNFCHRVGKEALAIATESVEKSEMRSS